MYSRITKRVHSEFAQKIVNSKYIREKSTEFIVNSGYIKLILSKFAKQTVNLLCEFVKPKLDSKRIREIDSDFSVDGEITSELIVDSRKR